MPVTIVVFLLVLAYGISFTMIGPLMPHLLERYGLKLAEGGTIVSIQNLSGLIAIIFCGLFGDRLDKKFFVGLSVGLFTVSLLGIGLAPNFPLLMAIFFVFGIGSRAFDTLSNALISDLHGDRRSQVLNVLHTFFGIGAFLGPLFVFTVTDAGISWDKTFLYLGYLTAALFLGYILIVLSGAKKEAGGAAVKSGDGIGLASIFTHSRMWVLGFILFIHMGVLGVLITWLPLFASGSTDAGAFMSSFALSVFWIGIILSRILLSRLSVHFGEVFMIRWGSLLSVLIFTPALVLGDAVILTIGTGIMGLFVGFTIPYLMSLGCGWYPDKSAAVTSMLFIFGFISVAAYPWASGLLGDHYGLIAAMSLVVVSQVVLFGVTWFLPGRERPAILG